VAFPDDVLVEGERVVLHRHPHWRVLVGPVLAFLLVVGVAGYVSALARGQGWHEWGWPAVAATVVVLVGTLTVVPVARWRTAHLVVTTRRLLVREGVHRRQGIQVPLDGITEVRTQRAGRLAVGRSLVVRTAAGEELEFVDVPHPDQARATIEAGIGAVRGSRARPG
jgi:membrane protein YdbS with pleckstrin-like domain